MATYQEIMGGIAAGVAAIVLSPLLIPYGFYVLWKERQVAPTVGFKQLPDGEVSERLTALAATTGLTVVERQEKVGLMGIDPEFVAAKRVDSPRTNDLRTGDEIFDAAVALRTQIPYQWDPKVGPIAVVRDGQVKRYRNWSGGPIVELDLLSRLTGDCRKRLADHVEHGGLEDGLLFGDESSPEAWELLCEQFANQPENILEELVSNDR